ncbi:MULTISPECIES: HIRAN domain-containing protein [Aeromonas]|uniref:HIRAN domain-containing protein n=1 Tax=Aeromonas media TaxID=651 RepID=A0AAW5RPZ1_AERME|nr:MULTISPECIES: HIRAN domain-containing protein [Aeromonas]MCV3290844.1 HIRAN domain-containing protein [Aeromonas media]MDH0358061.1 HIRAN domain-containing protein [Aeromonas caviae]
MRDDQVKDHWDIMAAGVSHNGRYKTVESHVYEGEDCLLVREENHPRDKHAVQLHTLNGHMVGYVPKEHAEKLSGYLDDGCHLYNAFFSRILRQGKYPIPCVRINVYLSSAQLDDRILRKHSVIKHAPTGKHRSSRTKGRVSWITWIVLAIILWWCFS